MTVSGLVKLGWRGPLVDAERDAAAQAILFERSGGIEPTVRDTTASIIQQVRERGDAALRALEARYDDIDRAEHESLEVPRDEWRRALAALPSDVRRALARAAENIRAVHDAFRPTAIEMRTVDGVRIGRRPDPLARVGIYAPGGRAAYPSSLLMAAVPARVAGVREIIVCSPAQRATRLPHALVLAAAEIADIDRLFTIGGAGAIAAMAVGTHSVPVVDRVVGPGNAFVSAAKSLVAGTVGIDSPAGPSELLVIADLQATPLVVAREMLAQAEHDPDAAVVCVLVTGAATDDARDRWCREFDAAMRIGIEAAPRAEIIDAALARRGALLWTSNLEAAVAFASRWAPEHLLLALESRARNLALRDVRHAGTVFLGELSSVAFGDYLTGANHVLPTGGSARAWSGLSPLDFVRWTTWQEVDDAAAARLSADTAVLAEAEGLPAHAAAAAQWRTAS
jgi:histidinol dehydrogenase